MTDQDNIRVLLVDDSDTDRESAFREIYDVFCVLEAKTGRQAVDMVKQSKPACVLLDYQLPDFDGLELLKRFVEQQIPVVMLTGQGNEELAARAIKMGAEDYLPKSTLARETLTRAVANAIEKSNLRRKLEDQQRDIADFVAFASDEMKSPLRDISLATEAIGKQAAANQEDLEAISESVAELLSLIDAMVEYTHVDRLSGKFESVDLEKCIDAARAALDPQLAAAGATISPGRMPIVKGIATALTEVFRHLIRNAIKTASNIPPQIRIDSELIDDVWTISVTNYVAGNRPETSAEKLRERPENDEHVQRVGGLGVVTCARIIKQHGGRVWGQSDPAGTTFRFTLPKAPR
jgi:light-regulated signal transduction histidine kinase (bacteriophytochrome)